MNVVIAGGGVAALEATIALRQLAGERVSLTLVAPEADFVYRPVAVLEAFSGRPPRELALAVFSTEHGAEFVHDGVASVDAARKTLITTGGTEIRYDALIIATGASVGDGIVGARTIDPGNVGEAIAQLIAAMSTEAVRTIAFVVPQLSWPLPTYELALLLNERAREQGANVEISIITAEASPLAIFGSPVSAAVAEILKQAGVQVITSGSVAEAEQALAAGRQRDGFHFDRVVALPLLRGPRIDGLPGDEFGFLPVDAECAVTGIDAVHAAGDATNFPIKFGGIATQQADTAAAAVAALAGAETEPIPMLGLVHAAMQCSWSDSHRRLYFTARIENGEVTDSLVSEQPTSSPAAKISGRYLGPYLDRRWASGTRWLADQMSWDAVLRRVTAQNPAQTPTA